MIIQICVHCILIQQYVMGDKLAAPKANLDSPSTSREPLSNPANEYAAWKDPRCPIDLRERAELYANKQCNLIMSEHKYDPRPDKIQFPQLAYTCAGSTITFIAIGNTGIPKSREPHPIHQQIGTDVVNVIKERQAQFAVYLGNTFNDGVKDVDDTRWETEWAERFEVEQLDIPFFAVNGNCEYKKNVTATGCYSEQGRHKKYWILPDSVYSLNVGTIRGNLQSAFRMFFIDTELSRREYTNHNGQADDDTLNMKGISIEEYRKHRMIFLVGHRPIHSTLEVTPEASLHNRRTLEMETIRLSDMRYDTYISGHVPGMEYIQDDSFRDYFGIGGGGGEPLSKQSLTKKTMHREAKAEISFGFAVFQYDYAKETEEVTYYYYEKRNGAYTLRERPSVIKKCNIQDAIRLRRQAEDHRIKN